MKLSTLTLALACAVSTTGAFAAALDRSGQSISAFLQPNNYFEVGVNGLMPTVEGKEAGTFAASGKTIDNMSNDYLFGNVAIKLQPTEHLSFGIIADQPFGAAASYHGDNAFVSNSSNTLINEPQLSAIRASTINNAFNALTPQQIVGSALKAQGVDVTTPTGQARLAATLEAYNTTPAVKTQIDTAVKAGVAAQVDQKIAGANALLGTGGTNVKVTTNNISLLMGFSPNKNITVYGGPTYQTVEGKVSLRGQAYSIYNGYDAEIPNTDAWGWLVGAAYQIPEIALKASLTYRSKIDYDINVNENIPTLDALQLLGANAATAATGIKASNGTTNISTPQSVNLDLQSGIMADTLAFANIRWVNWKDFSIRPHKFGQMSRVVGPLVSQPNGFDLVAYDKDQWSVNTGIGRKFSDKWSGVASLGWDSGAGNPITTLGPTEGYWNVGLGAQYSPAPNYFVSGGVKYFWLGDAKAQTGAQFGTDGYVADFADNSAIAVGMKIGYRF